MAQINPKPATTSDDTVADALTQLSIEFDRWRSQKTSSNEKIPHNLLEAARQLAQERSHGEVRRVLGVSKAQLEGMKCDGGKKVGKKNAKRSNLGTKVSPVESGFIPCQVKSPGSDLPTERAARLDVVTAQGVTISVSGLTRLNPLELVARLLDGEGVSC